MRSPAVVVSQIWRYPVKSLGGERIGRARVGPDGIAGDRLWAIRDKATGRILSAKRHPALLGAVARHLDDSGDVAVTLPDGTTGIGGSTELDGDVSRWLGISAELVRRSPGVVSRFEMDVECGSPEQVWVLRTVRGWFFDGRSPIHLLTSSSLAAGAVYHPEGTWDVRRFRPNLLLDTAGPRTGFVEDAWIDMTLVTGELQLWLRKACDRCVMTTRAQPGLRDEKAVLHTLAANHAGNLGLLANPIRAGDVAEGDGAVLVPTPERPAIPDR